MTTMDGQLIDGGGSCGEKGEEGERPRFWCGGWRVSALPSPTLHGNTYLQYVSFTKRLGSITMHLIQCEYLNFVRLLQICLVPTATTMMCQEE